jgi:hypothetical protein
MAYASGTTSTARNPAGMGAAGKETPMDALTSIVTALAAGAAAGLNPTVAQAVKDGYAALKALIQRKYAQVNVDLIEQGPASEGRRTVVQEDLAKTNAATDPELLRVAKALLDALQRQAPEAAAAVGVDLKDIQVASLTIDDVIATGTGVKVEGATVSGEMTVRGVRAGSQGGLPPNP